MSLTVLLLMYINYALFQHTENVLSTFKGLKLEGVHNKTPETPDGVPTTSRGTEHYFAKFLTNQKLLELQLSDVNFRRYVLVQFLELFQYLNATVKFKKLVSFTYFTKNSG